MERSPRGFGDPHLICNKIRARRASKLRKASPLIERLEAREVLSTMGASQVFHPMYSLSPHAGNGPNGGLSPSQVKAAYGFNNISFNGVVGDGTGQTIAIVDAYDDPNIAADLAAFSAQFNLPAANLTVVNQNGGTNLPPVDPTGGWELETALDVEWAHAIAPGAKILLVEANSASSSNLLAAVNTAANMGAGVVSMSWGSGEFGSEINLDNYFNHAGVVYTASSGDAGAPVSWPSASPNVLAVGGTNLSVSGNTYVGETGWSGSGGGPSAYYTQPSYQSGVVTQTTKRGNPDVAYDADPATGFAVYDSYPENGTTYGWVTIGGTSAGAPQWAALVAIADQGRAAYGLPAINATSPTEIHSVIYKNTSAFRDITSGTSTGTPNYSASTGYDFVTGVGSPIANLVVQALDGTGSTKTPDHLAVAGASTDVAGSSYTFTVTALTSAGATDSAYLGNVTLTTTDSQVSGVSHTFTTSDKGVYTFTVVLKTAGNQSITATDTTTGATSATSSTIAVSPAAASQFILSGLASTAGVGASNSFTISAKDPYGNVATGYTGTVTFTSTDASAGLPVSHTFSTSDKGVFTASIIFNTAGTQTVTASGGGISTTSSGVTVSPTGTITLAASAGSTGQINLSWNTIGGATGYTIQRSANGSSAWSTVATTASASSTYTDSGLTAGTTYYYRVQATGGNGSAFSNVANATTTGSVITGTSLSLYSNSSTATEDYYSSGSYELGVKIRVDVAGQIGGLRFYKQSWMGGYTHVGHLWSSSGVLLATMKFSNETASGWQTVSLSNPVSIAANTVYIASFSTGGGYFGYSSNGLLNSGVDNGPLHALANGVAGGDGVYSKSGSFPSTSGNGKNFYADVVFAPTVSGVVAGVKPVGTKAGSGFVAALGVPSVTTAVSAPNPTPTAPSKVTVNTTGQWPGRRASSPAIAFAIGRNRYGLGE